jgi:hypothetical protein
VPSYAHRPTRQTAVFAGIDREALSEYLPPAHCAFPSLPREESLYSAVCSLSSKKTSTGSGQGS